MAKKPTKPFGGIVFPKHGSARPSFRRLPDDKDSQERGAFEIFTDLYNGIPAQPRLLTRVEQLPLHDHDFSCFVGDDETLVQLTELVDRTYLRRQPPGNQHLIKIDLMATGGAIYIDAEAQRAALCNAIGAKIAKNYARPAHGRLWLVVFSTHPYALEFVRNGALHMTVALKAAREYLRTSGPGPFSEIWFTDLRTHPIHVWPVIDEEPPVEGGA